MFDKKIPELERVPDFDEKYLKKAGGPIGRNVVQITMKMRAIVRIMQIIVIIKPHLKNSLFVLFRFFGLLLPS